MKLQVDEIPNWWNSKLMKLEVGGNAFDETANW